ncbi:MAG TPA: S1/P1 nuclease [Flavisolibacter sp.]|nr:S1/P1 nuclease [Flavisolibacter sp.]
MRKIIKQLLVTGLVIYLPLTSMAWGMLGHRIVGEIADSYLTPHARAEIKKILGNESIALSSTWADFIKSDSAYKYLNTWHYIDFDEDMAYDKMVSYLKKDTAADAYTKINFLVKELKKKNLPADKKKMYLRLLIHIVGDIHQPLHVSHSGDMGGNDIKITWFGQNSNLHRLWDEQLIQEQQLSFSEYTKAINYTTAKERQVLQKQPITKWLFDSYQISQQLHAEIKEPNPKLGFLYNYQHIDTLNKQLVKAGVHLAGLLNAIFG